MKKILFIETCSSSPHLETTLELSKRHLAEGDLVSYHFIGHATPFNDFPKPPERIGFFESSSVELGAKMIRHRNFSFTKGEHFKVARDVEIPLFPNTESLREYSYRNYKAGLSCLSSLISKTKHSAPQLESFGPLVTRMLVSGISTYQYTLKTIRAEQPDLVYVFNGRFVNNRAILDATIYAGVPFLVHERGANTNRYSVTPFTPHNLSRVQQWMLEIWEEAASVPNRDNIARQYFYNQRNCVEQAWLPMIKGQTKGKGFYPDVKHTHLITYFSSSDDEIAAVGDDIDWGPWQSQENAFLSLLKLVRQSPEIHLVVRLHPHLTVKHPEDLQKWLRVDYPQNVTVLLPDDPTDTYALMEQSSAVISFGSTTGVESVFWGTPSICLGPNMQTVLHSAYQPKTMEELRSLLSRRDLVADPEKVLPFGYFRTMFGEKFKYYKAESLFKGKFLGVNIQEEHSVKKIKRILQPVANRLRRFAQGV